MNISKSLLLSQRLKPETPKGQFSRSLAGTTSFVIPDGVDTISAVCVAAGKVGPGGRGGDLRFAYAIPVTPNEILTVTLSATETKLLRDSTVLLCASNGTTSTPLKAGVIGGGNGGNGGSGSWPVGGGAGGYSGNGATGVDGTGGSNAGNGGGGGAGMWFYDRSFVGYAGGGGVGIMGAGPSGGTSASANANSDPNFQTTSAGKGGSGGNNAVLQSGGSFGGGGGFYNTTGGPGGSGAIRIIWGPNRFYPSTNVQDV